LSNLSYREIIILRMFLYTGVFYIIRFMPQAFVLMNAELGSEDSIVNELKKIEGVKEVYQVYGVYDIVAQVESNTMERVKETITWKLRKLNGVKSTLTMIVME
jgi:DNA-binding Lrp family transcriptional regulator